MTHHVSSRSRRSSTLRQWLGKDASAVALYPPTNNVLDSHQFATTLTTRLVAALTCSPMDDLNPPLWVADSPNLPQAPAGTPPDATSNFAFLVHSQNTLRNTLPPNVDNASMARQKRRRTSPEDQAILEAEFIKDVKPNKATRKAIADRVRGMGEKEVQVCSSA